MEPSLTQQVLFVAVPCVSALAALWLFKGRVRWRSFARGVALSATAGFAILSNLAAFAWLTHRTDGIVLHGLQLCVS
jgi:hypothetical protein